MIECSVLSDMFPSKFSTEFLMQLLSNSSFDVVFQCLLEFVESNQGFDFEEDDTVMGEDFRQENIF